MGKTNKKYDSIHLDIKPVWKIGKGHNDHIGGSGSHDNRPKRSRTRADTVRKILRDYD